MRININGVVPIDLTKVLPEFGQVDKLDGITKQVTTKMLCDLVSYWKNLIKAS